MIKKFRSGLASTVAFLVCAAAWQPCLAVHTNQAFGVNGLPAPSSAAGSRAALSDPGAAQAADILGIESDTAELLYLQSLSRSNDAERERSVFLRGKIFRSIIRGACEVRVATNSIEQELTYTYDLLEKTQGRHELVSQIFNLLTFVQFGTLYTLEGYSRMEEKFIQSAVLTGVSSGLGITLPTMNILYGKFAKTNPTPPREFASIVTGKGVNELSFPPFVERFLNTPAPGATTSRRRQMYSVWKQRYGTDAMAQDALHSLLSGKRMSDRELYNRIVHLWSLHTFVEDFDNELLALLRLVHSARPPDRASSNDLLLAKLGLSNGGRHAARLLGIGNELAELATLNTSGADSLRRRELETLVLGQILYGSLELRVAADKIYEEMNIAYDVVLAELESRRSKALQRNYEANFIQTNTFGSIACLLYLKEQTKAGNEMFVMAGSISMALTSLGLILMRGGRRKNEYPPNSLADFFGLSPLPEYRFSPFVSAYLDTTDPRSPAGLTNKQELLAIWKRDKTTTLNLANRKNQEKLAGMPSIKYDTIKFTQNRVSLLNGLRVRLQLFDQDLSNLLAATKPRIHSWPGQPAAASALDKRVLSIARMLDVAGLVERIGAERNRGASAQERHDERLIITRAVLAAMLEVRKTVANIELETAIEKDAQSRLKRYRDLGIQLTNHANFYQIGILGVIADGPLGLSSDKNAALYNERLTIISGLMACGLAAAAFAQRFGGIRLKKAHPNMLGSALDIKNAAQERYSPLVLEYLNVPDPESPRALTRRQELIRYWTSARLLTINVKKESTAQKAAATGEHHHWWNENIRLISNRINMLYDLRSVASLMERDLAHLIAAVE